MQEKTSEKPQENSIFKNLPYLGRRVDLKDTDPEHMQPALSYSAHTRIFRLSDEKDLKDYTAVWDSVVSGMAQIGIEERQYIPEEKTWIVLLRWVELFYKEPDKKRKQ